MPRQAILDTDATLLDPALHELVGGWLAVGLAIGCEHTNTRPAGADLPAIPTLTPAPALILRPRSRVLLAEAYKQILLAAIEFLGRPGAAPGSS